MLDGLFINNHGPYAYDYQEDTKQIDVTTLSNPKPDPEWFSIDTFGHFHAFDLEENNPLPTLKPIHERFTDEAYGPLVSFEYQCAICGEGVHPHYIGGGRPSNETIDGLKSASINIPRYDRDIGHEDRVSFYSKFMFGIARVAGFHFQGPFDGKSVSVDLTCEFVVRRSIDL